MNIKAELFELKKHFFMWFVVFIFVAIVLLILPVSFKTVGQVQVPVLSKSATQSVSAQFFIKIKSDLLPTNVELISMSPIAVFITQIKISVLGSFLMTLPYLFYALFRYLSPALFAQEKKIFFVLIVSLAGLFSLGVIFSYLFLIAPMFTTLLTFTEKLGLKPYLAVDEFISWTITSLLIAGTLFLLPFFMYVLTVCRLSTSAMWAKHWREAIMVFLIAGSIVTPDMSGVSLLLLAGPGIVLYSMGIIFSYSHEKRNERSK